MVQDASTLEVAALCFDAVDPLAQARFWAEALRWEVHDDDPADVRLVPTDGNPFGIRFRPVAGRPVLPARYHLDLTTSSPADQAQTVARLVELGGRRLHLEGPGEDHIVLADPEGNELCIIGPDNRFLADCGRLGALNGDGTQAVGYFWAEALGWPLVWDEDEETAIRAPDGTGPIIAWGGPPVAPKVGPNRLRLQLVPAAGIGRQAAVDRLLALGARPLTPIPGDDADDDGSILLADPDGNELRLLDR